MKPMSESVPPAGMLRRYIGDLDEVMSTSKEYLEDGGVVAFTAELSTPEDCKAAEVSLNARRCTCHTPPLLESQPSWS